MRPLHLGKPYERTSLPYFVYGTLRPEMGNQGVWRQHGAKVRFDGHAYVRGFQLIDRGIPYAVWTDRHDDLVVGALIEPPDEILMRNQLRESMDTLEGYPTGYNRAKTLVRTPQGPTLAWIYTPTTWIPTGRVEETGDYRNCRLVGRGWM